MTSHQGTPHDSGTLDVSADAGALADKVAAFTVERMLATTDVFRVSLAGGSTPKSLYERLAAADLRERIPWPRIHWYFGDERFVPPDHPDSNFRMVNEALFAKAPVPSHNIHRIPTDSAPDDAAARYEQTLRAAYGRPDLDPAQPLFDICLLGLGEDGHTASLLPHDGALDERSRWVMPVAHGRPEPRITLTYPAIESSRTVAFLVTGAAKSDILKSVRGGAVDAPAARVRPIGSLIWFADSAAARM